MSKIVTSLQAINCVFRTTMSSDMLAECSSESDSETSGSYTSDSDSEDEGEVEEDEFLELPLNDKLVIRG
jgi:hypothetical protein